MGEGPKLYQLAPPSSTAEGRECKQAAVWNRISTTLTTTLISFQKPIGTPPERTTLSTIAAAAETLTPRSCYLVVLLLLFALLDADCLLRCPTP